MQIHAVVPLKEPALGKSRLAGALEEAGRLRLIRTMLDHVVDAAVSARGISEVGVLTRDPAWAPRGSRHLEDSGEELNAALARAARLVRASGAGMLLILAADLPLVTPDDIEALAEAARHGGIAAAPDWSGTGTNALAVPLRHDVPTRFGPGSLEAHRAAAHAARLRWSTVRRPGLAFDLDEPEQLESLARSRDARYAFLADALS